MSELRFDRVNEFSAIGVGLASPEQIREWSFGEVKKPETINYRTYRAEKDGLFCERIFGPERDWECFCGKYRGIKHKGIICDRCGVKVTSSRERRKRMGHINLASPVVHIWFFRAIPSRLGTLLGMKNQDLEKIIYFQSHVVIEPGPAVADGIKSGTILNEKELAALKEKYPEGVITGIGAEAIKALLEKLDPVALGKELRQQLQTTTSEQVRKDLLKRLKLVDALAASKCRPEWMVLEVIPVIPPDLRPLVLLESGNFATSDLNDLYRRVINRNNRLKKLLELHAPEVIIRNEKRMLQHSVDALFDNERCRRPVLGNNNRPLKSLTSMIKGKQGRFRENLLGKRVDYSGRSVIVVGPSLRLHQCGLPKGMALELFQPFVIRKLRELGYVDTIKSAKMMIERQDEEVWDILDSVIQGHPVLLNRAPTLHRMGIQAFQPVLVEGDAIQIHPMVCEAYNADFDGDAMAVHIPLSVEAQTEARTLMMSTNNIFSPAHGEPIVRPTLDMVFGCYYLTHLGEHTDQKPKLFGSVEEVLMALDMGKVQLHTPIRFQLPKRFSASATISGTKDNPHVILEGNWRQVYPKVLFLLDAKHSDDGGTAKKPDHGRSTAKIDLEKLHALVAAGKINEDDLATMSVVIEDLAHPTFRINRKLTGEEKFVLTTPGRVIFNDALPEGLPFYNIVFKASALTELVQDCERILQRAATIQLLDVLKELGFRYATRSGLSVSIEDLKYSPRKQEVLREAEKKVKEIERNYRRGVLTPNERYHQIIEVWHHAKEEVTKDLIGQLKADTRDGRPYLNPFYIMWDSGARGGSVQISQMAAMRGLMTKPSGQIMETPIRANFREGLPVLEYFSSTHGGRKGLADTALKTAESGYLTRKLSDVAQSVFITELDCGTPRGVLKGPLLKGEDVVIHFHEAVRGRVSLEKVIDRKKNEVIVEEGQLITPEIAQKIEDLGYTQLRVRSPMTCESRFGICAKCYGADLSTGELAEEGLAVGIIAAQSIGEPGTQLTMRTFHYGGTAVQTIEKPELRADAECVVRFNRVETVQQEHDLVVLNTNAELVLEDLNGREIKRYPLKSGTRLRVKDGTKVGPGKLIANWDPHVTSLLSKVKGKVKFQDIEEGVTLREEVDPGGIKRKVIAELRGDKHPQVIIVDEKGATLDVYYIPERATLEVEEGEDVDRGSVIAKSPREIQRIQDITGGLPRVIELVEARKPKDPAIISEISGVVRFGEQQRGKRTIIVRNEEAKIEKAHPIPHGKHIIVHANDQVREGTPLVDGPLVPQDLLRIQGEETLMNYLLTEIQSVYRSQGRKIDDKHIAIIIRRMLGNVRIGQDVGDTDFLPGSIVSRAELRQENERVIRSGGRPAAATPILMGITKASLQSDSWIAAASFQETTRVLTEASLSGRVDTLRGIKENVITGKLIPVGTGYHKYLKATMKKHPLAALDEGLSKPAEEG